MPNFTENSRTEFEKFPDISRAPLPLFQVAMLMQSTAFQWAKQPQKLPLPS